MTDSAIAPCPLCLGPLVDAGDGAVICADEKHRYDAAALSEAQRDHVNRALWNAVRAFEDEASCSRWIARDAPDQAVHQVPKADRAIADSNLIRGLITALQP